MLGDNIVLMIADTGIGIGRIAGPARRPFEQVESQLTKTYHRFGAGLAIARSLTHLHGGSIDCARSWHRHRGLRLRCRAIRATVRPEYRRRPDKSLDQVHANHSAQAEQHARYQNASSWSR